MLATTKNFLRDLWALTAPYWRSKERWKSGALLAVIVGLNLGLVGLNVIFNEWNNLFYNTLQDKNFGEFSHQLFRFCWLAAAFIVVAVYQTYLRQMLTIRWRRWLTDRYIGGWLAHRAYYRLQLANKHTDNPDQRIADDIGNFISQTLSLCLDFMSSVVTLASFALILWNLSGAVSLLGVEVPGYMLWVALIYAIIGTWLVAKIGRPLVRLNFQQQQFEANFRFSLVRLRENAEGVALYAGEAQEARGLDARFADVIGNWWGIMRQQKKLNWFSSGYAQIAIVFPFIVGAPRYFSGAIQLGGLMQTASAFGQVQGALSWFVSAFASLAEWKATVDRLTSFEAALAELGKASEQGAAQRRFTSEPRIAVDNVDIWLPDGSRLLEKLRLQLPEGSRTLITGASGSGKSTLFRVLAGLWPYCDGVICFPAEERLLFLPQKPYLPIAMLRVAVAYPDPPEAHSDAEIQDALTACGLASFADRLDEDQPWGQLMSGGEQQRLAIARALLVKPRWLFLDEATSSLDEATEAGLYQLIVERLPQTGLISIAHHPALAAFHNNRFAIAQSEGTAVAHLASVAVAPDS